MRRSRQAVDLARVEVQAIVDITALPSGTERPSVGHLLLPVTYNDANGNAIGTATIVYLASTLFQQLPDDLIAYNMQDTRFPHYSTGDQFLTEEQFRRLVLFGRAVADTALHHDAKVRDAIYAALEAPNDPASFLMTTTEGRAVSLT